MRRGWPPRWARSATSTSTRPSRTASWRSTTSPVSLRSMRRNAPACSGLGYLGGTLGFAVAIADSPSVCVSHYGSRVPSMIGALDEAKADTVPLSASRAAYIPFERWRRWRRHRRTPPLVLNLEEAGSVRQPRSGDVPRRGCARRRGRSDGLPHGALAGEGMSDPLPPSDLKDWTWVLQRPCWCGFEPAVDLDDVPALPRANAGAWRDVLERGGCDRSPHPHVGLHSSTPATCATCSCLYDQAWR